MLAQPGSPSHASATALFELAARLGDGFTERHAEATFGDQQVGHRRRPVAGVHRTDRQRMRQRPARHHRIDHVVAASFEFAQRRPDRPEHLDRTDALGASSGVRRPAVDAQPERQRTRVGRDDVEIGGLGDDAGIGAPATLQGGERAEAAVLLALDGGHQHVAAQATPLRRTACTATCAAIRPAFMSQAPRPNSRPPRTSPLNGDSDQASGSPVGTTSMCPLSISVGPSPVPGSRPTSPHASDRGRPPSRGSPGARSASADRAASGRPPAHRRRTDAAMYACASFSPSVPLTLGSRTTSATAVTSWSSRSPTDSNTRARACSGVVIAERTAARRSCIGAWHRCTTSSDSAAVSRSIRGRGRTRRTGSRRRCHGAIDDCSFGRPPGLSR